MRKLGNAIMAILLGGAIFAGIALSQASIALADEDNGRGNPHGCLNPAGHVRGWCKHENRNTRNGNYSNNYTTISGTVIALNGDLVQFREDNGATVTLNQSNLLGSGTGLRIGGHYSLRGYWSNNMFVAQTNGGYNGNGYPNGGNGYPSGSGSSSIQGVITSISGNRVTMMQGLFSTITIDDQQALNNGAAQNLYVGRSVTAYGFWSGNLFYATSIG